MNPTNLAQPPFHERHVKIRRQRLGPKLPQHQGDLPSMVRGMVREVLHQVHQAHLRPANRQHSPQDFIGQASYELDLLSLGLGPLCLNRSDVRKCLWMEQGIMPVPQIGYEGGIRRWLPPKRQPTPLAANDVKQSIAYRAKAA